MASFIQYLQTNLNYKYLSQYGGVSPMSNARIWVGVANEDPKSNPQEVFIIDAEGHKQTIQQPFSTDDCGNFVINDDRSAQQINPQINNDTYSLYVEFISNGHLSIYQRKSVSAGFNAPDYQAKSDLKDITKSDKTQWSNNAPTALSVDSRLRDIEDKAIYKDALSDSIDSNNKQVGANSAAVYHLKNYYHFDNKNIEHITSTRDRSKTHDYGLMKFTLIDGGQGGQGNVSLVDDNKGIQLQGGRSGAGLIVWLIAEKLPDIMTIEVGQGGLASPAESSNRDSAQGQLGTISRLLFKIDGVNYEISTSRTKVMNLYHDFVHDFQYIPSNLGSIGRMTYGKNHTEPNTVISLVGEGGSSPILTDSAIYQNAGKGGNSGVCTSNVSTNRAESGANGIVLIQSSKTIS